jgi:hypothetical protein
LFENLLVLHFIQICNAMTTPLLSNFLQGGSGYAKRITFEKIILVNVKNPIIIDQNYLKALELVHILFYMLMLLYLIISTIHSYT